jgi:hypothetical protein
VAEEEEEKEGNASKTKWASEAYAFLSLFRRLRKRLPGLLMLLLGWGLLIRLVVPLTEDKPASGATSGAHGATGITSAFAVFLAGSATIAAYWFASSGCWKIPYLSVARFARPLASASLMLALFLFGILMLPLLVLCALGEELHFKYWLRRLNQGKVVAARKDAERELKEIYIKESKASSGSPISFEDWKRKKGESWISSEVDRIVKPKFKTEFETTVKFRPMRPWEELQNLVADWRVRLDSKALIGLAPFHSYSFDEEQKSAKAPLQIFAAAIRRLRLGLVDRTIVSRLRFITVPEIVLIESDDAARRWRAWLGLDTLMWGSYLSSNPPRIWLNLESKRN